MRGKTRVLVVGLGLLLIAGFSHAERLLIPADGGAAITVMQTWQDGAWETNERIVHSYNGQGKLTENLYQLYQSANEWLDQAKDTFTYDGSGNQTEMISWLWYGSEFIPDTRISTTYASGRASESIMAMYDYANQQWINWSRSTFHYDGQGRLEREDQYMWANEAWSQSGDETHTYNGQGQKEQSVTRTTNYFTTPLENASRETYTYDAQGNLTLEVQEIWIGGIWTYTIQQVRTYNAQNQLLTWTTQEWQYQGWANLTEMTTTYENGRAVQTVNAVWENGNWVNETRLLYDYEGDTAVDDAALRPGDFALGNYPNPFNPVTHIVFDLAQVEKDVRLVVFDARGREVAILLNGATCAAGHHEWVWDGCSSSGEPVASGVYYYRLSLQGATHVGRCLLLK